MGSLKPLPLIGTGLVCVGELLHIIGLATPNWLDAAKGDGNFGLFKGCGKGRCYEISDPPSELKATIAMTILGMLCGLVGAAMVIFFIVSIYMSRPPPVMVSIGGFVACIGACIFIAIGVIVFGVKVYADDFDASSLLEFGFSFFLCIVGAILMPIGGAFVYFSGRSMVV